MMMMGYSNSRKSSKEQEELGIEEAASAGVKSMQHLVRLLSTCSDHHDQQQQLCRDATEATVGNFKKLISALDRTGHARFRRGPPVVVAPSEPKQQQQVVVCHPVPIRVTTTPPQHPQKKQLVTLDFSNPIVKPSTTTASSCIAKAVESVVEMPSFSITSSSSLMSSITGEGSVSNGKLFGSSSCDVHHHNYNNNNNNKSNTNNKCHCSSNKRMRKSKVKRAVRVKAISSKVADIPSDDFSWRKYGQKPIKGSPYPRGYYKCSTVRGCPARKHVERDREDASMLIVTYEGEHRHTPQPIYMEHLLSDAQPPSCMLSLQHHQQH